jgi:hypothetical protein
MKNTLWLGGATDSGKTLIARKLADQLGLQLYEYDCYDVPHHRLLAETHPEMQAVFTESDDKRWINPMPEELVQRSLWSFELRFPLVLDDLNGFAQDQPIIVERFGLLPDFVAPMLDSLRQAIWLVPSAEFK